MVGNVSEKEKEKEKEKDAGGLYLLALKAAASFCPTVDHEFGEGALRYRARVIAALPALEVLDGSLVGSRCRATAEQWAAEVKEKKKKKKGKGREAAAEAEVETEGESEVGRQTLPSSSPVAPAFPPHGSREVAEAEALTAATTDHHGGLGKGEDNHVDYYACNSCNFVILGPRYTCRGNADCDACPGCYGMWSMLRGLDLAEVADAAVASAVREEARPGVIPEAAMNAAMRAAILRRRYIVARVGDGTKSDVPTFGINVGAREALLVEQTAKVKDKIAELR